MEWSHLNPPDLPDWSTFFSQVVCVEAHGTRQVFVAGQVGVDAGKRLAGDGGFEVQTERAFDNLGAALGHASGRWAAHRAREAMLGEERAQTLLQVERRSTRDRAQLQIASSSNEQDCGHLR